MRWHLLYAAFLLALGGAPCAAQENRQPGSPVAPAFEGVYHRKTQTMSLAAASSLVGAEERDPLKVLQAVLPKLDSLDNPSAREQATTAEEGRIAAAASGVVGALERDPATILRTVQSMLDGSDHISITEQVIMFKAGRIRFDMNSPSVPGPALQTYGIIQADSIFYVLPSLSRVVVTSLADLHNSVRRMGAQMVTADTAQPAMTDLGKRTIRGVQAHGYRLLWPTRATEIWDGPSSMLAELPVEQLRAAMGARAEPGWAKALPAGASFPLEQTTAFRKSAARGGGWTVSRTETELPVRQPLADSLFAIPAGWERMPMPDLPALFR